MRVYFDNSAFDRPFDDQDQIRIRIETEAKLYIQGEIEAGRIKLIWSYVNESENLRNPVDDSRVSIEAWKQIASVLVYETQGLLKNGAKLLELGLKPRDTLHVACAVEGNADFFLTTDDGILRKLSEFEGVAIANPVSAIGEMQRNDN